MGHTQPALCPDCGALCPKLISVPNFQEDRTRFWRNGNGGRFSSALGQELPDSRAGVDAVCKAKGIEMTSPAELPHVRRAAEVGRAKRAGEQISPKQVHEHIAEPRPDPIPLAETLRKSGKMRAVAERAAAGYENWPDRGAQSASEMARKGAAALAEGAAVLNSVEQPTNTI